MANFAGKKYYQVMRGGGHVSFANGGSFRALVLGKGKHWGGEVRWCYRRLTVPFDVTGPDQTLDPTYPWNLYAYLQEIIQGVWEFGPRDSPKCHFQEIRAESQRSLGRVLELLY